MMLVCKESALINRMTICYDRPIIGKHHSTTPKAYQDGRNGDYWETYPKITQDGAKLQKALLKPSKKIKVDVQYNFIGDKPNV